MTTTSELRAAAEKLANENVTCLHHRGKLDYDITEKARIIAQDWLSTHRTDGGEAITESRLVADGWEYDGGEVAFVRYVNDSDGEPQRLLFYGDRKLVIGSYAAKCKTMDDLRHLLAALGCEVQQVNHNQKGQ